MHADKNRATLNNQFLQNTNFEGKTSFVVLTNGKQITSYQQLNIGVGNQKPGTNN